MTSTTENYSTFMNTIKKCYDGILLQKFTHLCVSTILYKRRLLPTSCFKAVHFGQTEAVILKNETNNITHKNTIAWLDVVLDAIEKNYLCKLILNISIKDGADFILIDSYIFSYKNRSANNNDNNKKNVENEIEMCTENFQNIIDRLTCVLNLLTLPKEDTVLTVLPTYFEWTPSDYGAEVFKPNDNEDEDDAKIIENVQKIKNGQIITPNLRTNFYSKFNGNFHQRLTVIEFKCYCDFTDNFCESLKCRICGFLSHSCCYGKLIDIDMVQHICYLCHSDERKCTDTMLIGLTEIKRKFVALMRRGFFFCMQNEQLQQEDLENFKGTNITGVHTLINILIKYKILEIGEENFKVNHDRLQDKLPKWFPISQQ